MKRILLLSLVVTCLICVANAQRPGRLEEKKMPCRLLEGVEEREYSIYLPGSYDSDTLRQYPVLYLMHGGGESHRVWQDKGRLRQVADSLIDRRAIGEMIIVCPEGNERNMMYFNAPQWKYEDYFFQELLPYIEKTYRVRADKGGRAIAGFSMGGGAATVYGVHHPERISLVYDISGYLRRQPLDFLKNDPSAEWRQQVIEDNNPIRRIAEGKGAEIKAWQKVDWAVSVGDHDFTLEGNMDLVKALRQQDIPYSMHVGSGSHDWQYVQPAMESALKRASRNFFVGGDAMHNVQETLWIKNGDRHLYGVISRPPYTGKKQPVLIVAHGFNGTHHGGRGYFKALNQMGYQVYTFDFACGSVRSRSDDNTMNMSIRDEVSDLVTVIRHFQQQRDVDASRIVVIGESQGGLVSALTAAEHPKDIQKLILIYPALCIPDNWNERYPKLENVPDTTRLWGVPLGRRFFREIRELPDVKYIAKYKRPVLIVHGDQDPVVPVDYSRQAQKFYKDARLHVIPGAGHGYKPNEFEECIGQIRQFLQTL